jgi:hypothetical protein
VVEKSGCRVQHWLFKHSARPASLPSSTI